MWGKIKNLSKRDIALVVLALLVIGWAAYFYIQNRNRPDPNAPKISMVEDKFIAGFPKEFILEADITPLESRRIGSTSQNFWTATYLSQKPASEIFTLYKGTLEFLGWELTNSSSSKFIFAQKGSRQFSLAIEDTSTARKVALSIVEK